MNTSSHVEELDPSRSLGNSRAQRVLLAGGGFIAFETLFIWLLGDRVYDFPYFSLGFLGWTVLSTAGYFGLGFFSRSWLSALFMVVPPLVVYYFVYEVWVVNYPGGGSLIVNASLPEIWLTCSIAFVPAWALGVWCARGKRKTPPAG